MRDVVLIVTDSREPNVAKVIEHLDAARNRYVRVDVDNFLRDSRVTFKETKGVCSWVLRVNGEDVSDKDVCSVWHRRPPSPKASESVHPLYREFVENETAKFLWDLWTSLDADLFWMNHPRTTRLLEFNKLYQMKIASGVGLLTPETLVTNDPGTAMSFITTHGGSVAMKIFGGSVIQDEEGETLTVLTHRVSGRRAKQWLSGIECGPVMLQEYIEKQLELRVTMVGDRIFSCAIHSQDSQRTKDDWRRYDFDKVKHEIYRLPRLIEKKLRLFMRRSGITFGAIDLVLEPSGRYVFLEVNPNGQWGWIEHLTGMPISQCIAETLAHPPLGDT